MSRVVLQVAGRDPVEEASGGHSSYVVAHARAAGRAGFDPHLFAVAREGGITVRDYGTVHRIQRGLLPARQMFVGRHAAPLSRALVREGMRHDPVLLQGFGVWGGVAVQAARRLRRLGRRVAVVVNSYTTYEEENRSKLRGAGAAHGPATRLRYLLEVAWIRLAVLRHERMGYRGADRVLTNYESVRALLEAAYGAGPRVLRMPYAPISAFDRTPVPRRTPMDGDGVPHVVAVSRHDPRKGVDRLLHALAVLEARGLPFRATLVGGGPTLRHDRVLAERLGLSSRVHLAGTVPDVRAVLSGATVFVLPSLEEQSGSLAVLEAMQAGLPIVASACDGIPEDLTHESDALLVPAGSVDALAAALARLLAQTDLRVRLGREARRTFERRFDAPRMVEAYRALYERMLLAATSRPASSAAGC